jgi:c-di-GMP-binding flagellar brake protein YcgR
MLRRAIRKRLFKGKTAEEERKEPRVLLNLPIDYNAEKSPTSRPGYTSNLSPGGVLLNVPERLDIGQEISLRIFFAFGPELETVNVNSRVVWVRRAEKEGSYRSGVKFLDLSATDRKRLGRFFERF